MHVNFHRLHDYRDFLYSEYETSTGVGDAVDEKFARGIRAFSSLGDDLSLDDSVVDLEDIA